GRGPRARPHGILRGEGADRPAGRAAAPAVVARCPPGGARVKKPAFHPRQVVWVLGIVVLGLVARDGFFPSGFTRTPRAATRCVRPGESIDEIANDLVSLGLLKSPFAFSILARLTRTDRQLKAGQYTFHKGDSVLSILTVFVRGMSGQNLITIPEGQTAKDIA